MKIIKERVRGAEARKSKGQRGRGTKAQRHGKTRGRGAEYRTATYEIRIPKFDLLTLNTNINHGYYKTHTFQC